MKPSFITCGTLLTVLVTSLSVQAQYGGPPDPTPSPSASAAPAPTPPPTPECNGRSFYVRPNDAKAGRSFNVPDTLADSPAHTIDCSSFDAVEGKRLKGTISVSCERSGNNAYWSSVQNNCSSEEAVLQCRPVVSVGVSKNELFDAFDKGGTNKTQVRGDLVAIPNGDAAQSNIAKITMTCRAVYPSDNSAANLASQGFLTSNLGDCRSSDSGLCYLDPYNGLKSRSYTGEKYEFNSDGSYKPLVASGKSIKETIVYVWNRSNSSRRLNPTDIQFLTRDRIGGSFPPTYVARDVHSVDSLDIAGVATEATACDLRVSGVIGGYQATVPPSALVENDMLVFTVNMKGGTGVGLVPPKITYSGGPNPLTGVWENPPANSTALVTANVETSVSKNKFSCQLKVDTRGSTSTVRLRRFGDCGYFDALRSHFFMNASGTGFQNTGFTPGLTMPGINAQYGQSSPEIPYGGVLNAAASNAGEIIIGSGGSILLPPLNKRLYSKAVIVAKRFRSGGQVQDPLFWGIMDLNDYSITRMSQVDSSLKLNDEDTVVFQAFLAATQPSADFSRDLRGTGEGFALYSFAPATQQGKPFDKVIPFTNESCIPLFQAKPPLRADIKNPNPALTGVTQCLYSRPYTVGDIKNGRVDLTLMHLVPMHAHHQFPTELLKASSQPACVAKNPTDQIDCWDVKASSMGAAATTDPFASHDSCRTVSTTWVTQTATSSDTICTQSGGGNSPRTVCTKVTKNSTAQIPITTVTYKASCAVLEAKSECSANLAIRFSGYNQMMVAGLMCADKYNKPGDQVAATLKGQGIIPYTSSNIMGGSSPLPFTAYDPSRSSYGGVSKGVGCIPCRFGSDAAAVGANVTNDTEPLSVDQDSTSRRKPVFSFRKMKAPRECVRNVNFEVRYFGSQECNGVSNPAGHFCSSSNLGGQSCAGPAGEGSGNIAGQRSIPVCPNSGFEFDNVSVSWSPLLLDIGGTGIQISRDASYALKFDIRGDGRQRLVDWPINTNEVAFLVMPNKDGKVVSGKELFGEYRAKNGFDALSKFDSNKDQKIDKQDKDFDKLRLWFDRNRNGVYDEGEGALLADHGVETIYLQHRKITDRGTDGRTLYSVYFNNKFREFMNIADYYFNEYGVEKKTKNKK